jgi:hypothetical protein
MGRIQKPERGQIESKDRLAMKIDGIVAAACSNRSKAASVNQTREIWANFSREE